MYLYYICISQCTSIHFETFIHSSLCDEGPFILFVLKIVRKVKKKKELEINNLAAPEAMQLFTLDQNWF